ncbi:hypothetical protein L228DRAFT_248556 [Xylona heveae TC161]|uniref:HTH marR-type domain-containing protein n=1 Tax=Xylona heveae (strain CBS 132557 / TC161) TaxID=1328760 RepID=A0A165G6W0_XYLHT|nr:hypothetical protein L228DRAFT_248556 [Xylona heveae TC161]KZF21807.1 hypothetical protein L228DRAFT_248556 [Xylona heveae TC161]
MDIMNSFSVLDADGTGHTEDTSSPISTDSPSILEPNAGNDLAAKFYDAFNDIANEMSIINGKLKKVKSAEMTRQIVMAIERHGRDPNKDTATADGDGLPMTKLCNFLDKEKTSVSRWVRAAKKSGHVQEQRKSSDRRQKLLSLTESGWELFESLARTIADKIEPVLRHLSPKVNCEIFLENLEEFVVAFRAARLDIQGERRVVFKNEQSH